MRTWLQVMGAGADMEGVATEVIQQVTMDARPEMDTLKVSMVDSATL